MKLSSNQTLNKEITSESGILVDKELRSAENKKRVEIQILSGNGSGTTVVALNASNGNNRISTLGNSIGHQKLQFPDFVSTQLHSRKVVALEPDFCVGWEIGKVPSVNWSGKLTQERTNIRDYDN